MFKTLMVEALSTVRNPVPLADKIDQEVKKFLDNEKAVLTSMSVAYQHAHGVFGKALATVHYEKGKGKKEVDSK